MYSGLCDGLFVRRCPSFPRRVAIYKDVVLMALREIKRLFERGNVCVCGLRGTGKDMLIANVTARRRLPYISNVDYGGEYHPFSPYEFDIGGNTYDNFINGNIRHYIYPYPDGYDVYISDVGVYFPSQYCNELNRKYAHFPTFYALSRQLGDCNVHFNVQSLNRAWDKLREQSDTYVLCLGCKVILGIVFQKVRIYDKYESALNKVLPYPLRVPLFASPQTRFNVKMVKATYEANHGTIKTRFLVYRNKSTYDTRIFRKMLEEGGAV